MRHRYGATGQCDPLDFGSVSNSLDALWGIDGGRSSESRTGFRPASYLNRRSAPLRDGVELHSDGQQWSASRADRRSLERDDSSCGCETDETVRPSRLVAATVKSSVTERRRHRLERFQRRRRERKTRCAESRGDPLRYRSRIVTAQLSCRSVQYNVMFGRDLSSCLVAAVVVCLWTRPRCGHGLRGRSLVPNGA